MPLDSISRREFIKRAAVGGSVVMGSGFLAGCVGQEEGAGKISTLKIGCIVDASGPYALYGKDIANSQRDYARWANDNELVPDVEFETRVTDGGYKIEEEVMAYKRYRDSWHAPFVFNFASGAAFSLGPMAMEDKIILASQTDDPSLYDPNRHKYTFVARSDYATQFLSGVRWLIEKKDISTVSWMGADVRSARMLWEVMSPWLEEQGLSTVEAWFPGGALDLTSQVIQAKNAGAELVLSPGSPPTCSAALKAARDKNYDPDWVMWKWGMAEQLAADQPELSEGVLVPLPNSIFGEEVPGMEPLKEMHEKRHPTDTHMEVYVGTWACMDVILRGGFKPSIEKHGFEEGIKAQNVYNELLALKDFDTGGLTPKINYLENDHRPHMGAKLYEVKDGKYSPVSDWSLISREVDTILRE